MSQCQMVLFKLQSYEKINLCKIFQINLSFCFDKRMFHADSRRVHIDFYCHDVTILQPSVSNQAFFYVARW